LLIPLVWVVFAIWFSTYRSKVGSHGEQEKLWSVFKEYDRMIARQIMSQWEILQNNSIEQEIKLLKKNSLEYSTIYTKWSYRFAKNYLFTYFILVLLYIGIALYLGYQGNIWYTESLAFVAWIFWFIAFFHSQMLSFVAFFEEFISQYIQVKTWWQLLDSLTPIRGYSTWLSFSPHKKDIIISSITYGYNESKVFSDFSLTLARGKKTALVGASGGGKTTLMKLIAGYLHPESWSISVLGNQLDETALKTYYPHIGYLTQDPGVFDATIRENLVSALTATWDQKNIEQKLEKALRLAQCDFVFELEHGLDTEIGERGVRLSWGQKQRLAIAKIFLKDPEIILLDEPTSALDSFSEEKITEALNILFEWRTVIIVAHRLQTVKRADDIIVIEWWEVVERGNHSELVEKWGIYNRMLELQSGF
jgi:ABC-type multidrug transport system fused ATPase/permease subunit